MQLPKRHKRLIVVGDVHGQLEPFVKILQHAGLIDGQLNWTGVPDRLVQMGDVFDRGPDAREADALLDKIQKQAANSDGEVIRLVGNHELEIMLSNFSISGLEGTEAIRLRDKLTNQVLSGELRGAYAYKGILFTHAGVTRRLYKIFQMQLDDASASNVAVLINLIFRESLKHQFFKHPIFNISVSRSGPDKFGGIFWEDLLDLAQSFDAGSPVWQVVGHTQISHIIIDEATHLIPVDIGLHRSMQYLEIDDNGVPKICAAPQE
ncbi:MAG: metallophosphoesterase [Elusimicrobiaceae bacterium]|nr:metallophosphoesterase [Elusimicrobiaceae bacterium]